MSALDPDRIELAQRLMVEITARLENLAAEAAATQLSVIIVPGLFDELRSVLTLAEAHRAVLTMKSKPE